MKEKIEQLCEQIKDLLKKNDREYVVVQTPEETYSYPDFTFPEYIKNVLDNSEYYDYLLCDDSLLVGDGDDFLLDVYDEPVYDYDEEDYDEEDNILGYDRTRYYLIGIRVESGELLFAVESILTNDEQTACDDVKEVSIRSLVCGHSDKDVVRVLEAYVRVLSDEAKKSKFWKM